MANITYDERSYMIDGRRIWLVAGSLDYSRLPAELWAHRLHQARRAGLNCVTTCLPWNFHEVSEGQWDFTGDRDVAEFVAHAQDAGLYVILRVGPYIGSDWDCGGLPAWLNTKTGMTLRSSNAAYTHYFDKYFRQVLPRLADLQVTSGGNIVLIQNEHEYFMRTMPDRLNYLEFINQLFRRAGFEIPIITSNLLTDPPVGETVECVKACGDAVQQLKRLRLHQTHAPLMAIEHATGPKDRWGAAHAGVDAETTARSALEILGCGGQYNYSPWHGGTNFAYWAGRTSEGPDSYQTTSYDCDAPVAEGGALTRKYYLTRLVNMLADSMGPIFAAARAAEPAVNIHDATEVLNLAGPRGGWAVVTNNGRAEIATARVSLPGGTQLEVPLEPLGAMALPVDVQLGETHTLDYANVMPLGFFGEKILVLHAPADWPVRVSIDGVEICDSVPKDDQPKLIEHAEMLVVLINSDLAQRTWLVDDALIFGPQYVGQSADETVCLPPVKQTVTLSLEGELTRKKLPPAQRSRAQPPRLGSWSRLGVCTEPADGKLEWEKINGPKDVNELGIAHGYAWYRVAINAPGAQRKRLFLPDCADRASIYLNGAYLATWGTGEGATRKCISAPFKRGLNVLTLLVDNLGRFCDWPNLGERKGLYGHIHDAAPLKLAKPKLKSAESFPKRIIARQHAWLIPQLERQAVTTADFTASLRKVEPIHVSFADVPHNMALICNGRTVGFFPQTQSGTNFGQVTLGSELKKGKNVIQVVLWGQVDPKTLDKFVWHTLSENLTTGASWGYRPVSQPCPGGPVVGKNQPAWYTTKFKHAGPSAPLFLHVAGAKKGQIFINGHNAGRFWTLGPQRDYYLPECWLAERNELVIFEESGGIPSGSRLVFKPHGPFGD